MNKERTNLAIKILGGWYILTHVLSLISLLFALPALEMLESLIFGAAVQMVLSTLLILAGLAGAIFYLQHKYLGWQILLALELFGLASQVLFYLLGGLNQALAQYPTAILAAIFGAVVGFGFTGLKLWILWVTRTAFNRENAPKQ